VILQNPSDGAKVKRGRRIYLAISGGELLAVVPNLKGRTLRDAKFSLEREGLRLGTIEYQSSEEYPPNTIIDQLTATGARVKKETYVSVIVSQGVVTEKIPVPDLYGKTLADAQKLLTAGYLKLGNITYVPSPDLLPNTIIQQFPHAGELVQSGQAVDLIIVQAGDKKKELFEN
jgi:serine/threonine-protein kinase